MRARNAIWAAAILLGCSSTSTTAQSDAGAVADTGAAVDAGDGNGFDFVFSSVTANITRKDLKASSVQGSFCMGAGPKTCSFTGSVTDTASGCTGILNVAFVGGLAVGTQFPIVADAPTPPNKGEVSYIESCGATTRNFKATGGTLTLDAVTLPAQGFATGTVSFSVQGAALAPTPGAQGDAQGTFTVSGKGTSVGYTSTG